MILKLHVLFRNARLLLFLILLGSLGPHQTFSQDKAPPVQDNMRPNNPQQRKADKKKAARKAEGESKIQKGLERHIDIQSKTVQKRMKKSKKEAERINKSKKKPFYQRWFRKSQKSRKWYQFWKKRGKK